MPDPLALYHWSPTTRRKQIGRYGFRPSSRSVDRRWKPPFVCFADEPQLAWSLSGPYNPTVPSWDLWMVQVTAVNAYETIPFDSDGPNAGLIREYRVYERVYGRDVWYVGTRLVEET